MNLNELHALIVGGAATEADLRQAHVNDVVAIKKDSPVLWRGSGNALLRQDLDEEKREATFILSTQDVDRMGDSISVFGEQGGKGWQLEAIKAAGMPWQFAHLAQDPTHTVGNGVWIRRTRLEVKVGKAAETVKKPVLLERVSFMPEEIEGVDLGIIHPKALLTWGLVRMGRLKGCSVGFMPTMAPVRPDEDERVERGMPDWGVLYPQQEAMEGSSTQTPANPFCLGGKSLAATRADLLEGTKDVVARGWATTEDRDTFLDHTPLDAEDAAKRLRARLHSFVDMAATARGVEPKALLCEVLPDGTVECSEVDKAVEKVVDQGTTDAVSVSVADTTEGPTFVSLGSAEAAAPEAKDCDCKRTADGGIFLRSSERDLLHRLYEEMVQFTATAGELLDAMDGVERTSSQRAEDLGIAIVARGMQRLNGTVDEIVRAVLQRDGHGGSGGASDAPDAVKPETEAPTTNGGPAGGPRSVDPDDLATRVARHMT
jgi:hypothetical protein